MSILETVFDTFEIILIQDRKNDFKKIPFMTDLTLTQTTKRLYLEK